MKLRTAIVIIAISASLLACQAPKAAAVRHTEEQYQTLLKEKDRLAALPKSFDKTVAIYTFPQPLAGGGELPQSALAKITTVGKAIGAVGSSVGTVVDQAISIGKSLPATTTVPIK